MGVGVCGEPACFGGGGKAPAVGRLKVMAGTASVKKCGLGHFGRIPPMARMGPEVYPRGRSGAELGGLLFEACAGGLVR